MDDFSKFLSAVYVEILYPVLAVLFAFALLYFLYGVFVFIKNTDSDEARSVGKKHMVWGIVGLAIMVSAVSIVQIIKVTINQL